MTEQGTMTCREAARRRKPRPKECDERFTLALPAPLRAKLYRVAEGREVSAGRLVREWIETLEDTQQADEP